jgi:hypothetical protein
MRRTFVGQFLYNFLMFNVFGVCLHRKNAEIAETLCETSADQQQAIFERNFFEAARVTQPFPQNFFPNTYIKLSFVSSFSKDETEGFMGLYACTIGHHHRGQ